MEERDSNIVDVEHLKTHTSVRRHSVAFADFAINNPRSSIAVSCTLLFAMSQLFFGIVIPLSDSFVTVSEKETEHAYYLEAFLIIQYVTAIFGIFYLQGYVYFHDCYLKKKRNKDMNVESENDENNSELEEQDSQKVTFNLAVHSDNKLEVEAGSNDTSNEEVASENLNMTKFSHLMMSEDNRNVTENKFFTSPNLNSYYVIKESTGINLYLRLGAVGFGFGVMVHDGFKIADQVRLQGSSCHNQLWIPKQCLHLAYIFIQTFFIFKYHRSVFLKHKAVIRFVLYHLTISNICQWFKTVVYEINHELMEHHMESGITDVHGSSNNFSYFNKTCFYQLSNIVSPYLFPCAIEYSLISAAIFYKMLQRVGGEFDNKTHTEKAQTQIVVKNVQYSECHRSHKGLFVGLLFFMVTLVGLAIFLLFKKNYKTQTLAVMVYQVSELILLISSAVALVCAFIKMRNLSFCQLTEEEALDDNLLLIGLAGIFAYNLFLFISTIDSSNKLDKNKYSLTIILFIFKSLTEILQSMLQVLFVLESSRKCAQSLHHVRVKPGRSLVTFLIVTNLALWIVSIFEAKRADEHLIFTKYYQKTPWSIITHTLLPLIIFFRFHSSICLTDIWTKAYKMNLN